MQIQQFVQDHSNIVVITGAGVSTASGIPDYRDVNGQWKHHQPMQYQNFVSSEPARKRYWARSALGRERFKNAQPNSAHTALMRLEALGKISLIITQNVDGLHQRAGSQKVTDLHGLLDRVVCLNCLANVSRDAVQQYLMMHNAFLKQYVPILLADGDSQLDEIDFSQVKIPQCHQCGGISKPDVVFYGENVPAQRVEVCMDAIDKADALLIVGSSLMVYSGYRFAKYAHQRQIPLAGINKGITRADDLLSLKVEDDCGSVLEGLVRTLAE